jgi:hypothetical protein
MAATLAGKRFSIAAVGRPLLQILLRTAFCAVVAWFSFKAIGAFCIAVAVPLLGVLLSRPIIDFAEEWKYASKAAALQDVQGKWYEHRGYRIDIAEDIERARWLMTEHVRKVIKGLPRDEVLERQFEGRVGPVETFDGFRIRADALAEYLVKSRDLTSVKFKVWLDREVMGGKVNPRAIAQSKAKV